MVKAIVLFGHPINPTVFEDYYPTTHIALMENGSIARTEGARIVGTPDGSPPPYYRVLEMWFDTIEQLEQVLGSLEANACKADLDRFATGGATILIGVVD
jgi:uncharacterized protein (TIGR02118 family)